MAQPSKDTERGDASLPTCTRCGGSFTCGALAGLPRCWCMDFPVLPAPDAARGCYCPACLRELTAERPG